MISSLKKPGCTVGGVVSVLHLTVLQDAQEDGTLGRRVRNLSGLFYLILVARALAVLGQTDQRLVDEGDVVLVDVETQQTKPSRRTAANTI